MVSTYASDVHFSRNFVVHDATGLLYNVSVVVKLDAELDETSVDNVAECEDRIVNQSRAVLLPPGSETHVQQEVNEILRPFGLQTRLLVVEKANSLAVYFSCLTLLALMSLRDQWRSGQLGNIVQSLFTLLSGATREVHIKRLSWAQSDYERSEQFFSSAQGELAWFDSVGLHCT